VRNAQRDLLFQSQAEVLFLRDFVASGGAGDTAAKLHEVQTRLQEVSRNVTLLTTEKLKLTVDV